MKAPFASAATEAARWPLVVEVLTWNSVPAKAPALVKRCPNTP